MGPPGAEHVTEHGRADSNGAVVPGYATPVCAASLYSQLRAREKLKILRFDFVSTHGRLISRAGTRSLAPRPDSADCGSEVDVPRSFSSFQRELLKNINPPHLGRG